MHYFHTIAARPSSRSGRLGLSHCRLQALLPWVTPELPTRRRPKRSPKGHVVVQRNLCTAQACLFVSLRGCVELLYTERRVEPAASMSSEGREGAVSVWATTKTTTPFAGLVRRVAQSSSGGICELRFAPGCLLPASPLLSSGGPASGVFEKGRMGRGSVS